MKRYYLISTCLYYEKISPYYNNALFFKRTKNSSVETITYPYMMIYKNFPLAYQTRGKSYIELSKVVSNTSPKWQLKVYAEKIDFKESKDYIKVI
jgi:hypothetical protein